MNRKVTNVILVLGIMLVASAIGIFGYRMLAEHNAASLSDKIVKSMTDIIPQYDADDPRATGTGQDPLPMIEVEGVSMVGYLEMPSLGKKIPVADAYYDGDHLAFLDSGSPVKGHFVIGGSETDGGFACLKDLKPGDKVTFVDANGVRYDYKVSGMGSVKEITDLDHDLVMYCGISDETFLAVYADSAASSG